MRFAVDAHAIGRHLTGNEVYIRSLLSAFANLDRKSEFLTYLSLPEAEQYVPQRFEIRYVARNPFKRLGWDLPLSIARERPELLHVQYTAPLWCPVPVIASVHDVSFLEHPEYFTRARCLQLRATVKHTVQRASAILTGSEFSRDRIIRAYGIDEELVHIVHIAANPSFRPLPREASRQKVRAKFNFDFPFVLSVGDLQPRKNHIGLIKAFTRLLHMYPQLPHHLVLAGKMSWFAPKVREAARLSGFENRIHFTNFVSDEDLLQLYNACDLFIFPSFYEGFGIPILEAMACGRAVSCANTSSMPEVADGAGLLFDPYRTDEITRAMADVLLDPELRGRMERLGLQRAAQFTWQKTGERTLEIYREVAGRGAQIAARRESLQRR